MGDAMFSQNPNETVNIPSLAGWRLVVCTLLVIGVKGCGEDKDTRPRPSGPEPQDAADSSTTNRDTELDASETADIFDTSDASAQLDKFFEAVRQMRSSIAASPDHLPHRAEQLTKNGNPEAIYNFVRDNIAVVPDRNHSMENLTTSIRWGRRAALRSGRATVRETAEILAPSP